MSSFLVIVIAKNNDVIRLGKQKSINFFGRISLAIFHEFNARLAMKKG